MNASKPDAWCAPGPESRDADDGAIVWLAPAKLNLSLRVLGRRQDGYHQLDSVVAKVTLYDELTFRPREDGEIRLACRGLDCGAARDNLVVRAAEVLRAGRRTPGADIDLVKRIPAGAGLGGGSSDAAATLKALARLWALRIDAAELSALAGEVGSDVPLFVGGPAARIRGRGLRVEPIAMYPFCALVYVPDFACPTGDVYAAYDRLSPEAGPNRPRARRGGATSRWEHLVAGGAVSSPPSQWSDGLVNDLQPAARFLRGQLDRATQCLAAATGGAVHMTGSGSGLFVLADAPGPLADAMARLGPDVRPNCWLVAKNPW